MDFIRELQNLQTNNEIGRKIYDFPLPHQFLDKISDNFCNCILKSMKSIVSRREYQYNYKGLLKKRKVNYRYEIKVTRVIIEKHVNKIVKHYPSSEDFIKLPANNFLLEYFSDSGSYCLMCHNITHVEQLFAETSKKLNSKGCHSSYELILESTSFSNPKIIITATIPCDEQGNVLSYQ